MRRTWKDKFADAFRGLREGTRGASSFAAHALAATAVVVAATVLRMPADEWAVLLLCITLVVAAEYFNSALEFLARAVTSERNPHIRDALDVGSAAVLAAAIGSAAVGAVIFGHRAGQIAGWW